MRLKGKVALITGAGQGIGHTTAVLFAEEGAKVAVVDIDSRYCEETVEMIQKKGGEEIYIKADVSKAEDDKNIIDTCIEKLGRIDIIFNTRAGFSLN